MSTDPAADWLAQHHPDQLSDFPTDDTGRNHHNIALTDRAYWETDDTRPGTRRNPAWRRHEALATQPAELTAQAVQRAATAEADPCSHCHTNPVKYRRTRLCSTCGDHARRHRGDLPALRRHPV